MKPELLRVPLGPASSFSIRQDNVPGINNRWHYHPELELIYIKEGSGTQFVGDSIRTFHSGDVILVGSNQSHFWSFDDRYFFENAAPPDIYVAHFSENFLGREFIDIPENLQLKNILDTAKRGIQVTGTTKEYIGNILEKMVNAAGCRKVLFLLEALSTIASSDEISLLSSITFQPELKEMENDRINTICQYSYANYKRKIQIEEIASVANMSPNSFCRYFKTKTRKTYSHFLLELRVGIACKLLIENKISIKQICFESGFYNFTSFHKYFKMLTNKTPLGYQKEFLVKRN